VVLAGIVVPVTGHWVWYGWLHNLGFIDFGGATVIHLSSAVFAALGVAVVGARAGKYNRDGSSNSIPGHALPMLGIGSLLIFVGWFPYLLGCTATHYQYGSDSIMLAGAGGVVGGLVFSHLRYRKPDVFFTCSGLVAALVAISPAAVAVSGIGAVSIGFVAGVIVPIAAVAVDMRARLDDPLGLIVIHGVGSIWGTLAAAFFVVLGPESGAVDHFRLLAVQALGIVAVMVPTSIVAMIVFLGMKLLGNLRVPAADETDGLDIGEHDLNSYPDFQQTTIKSYHMREA
jgi:Amt family ammonium transporter